MAPPSLESSRAMTTAAVGAARTSSAWNSLTGSLEQFGRAEQRSSAALASRSAQQMAGPGADLPTSHFAPPGWPGRHHTHVHSAANVGRVDLQNIPPPVCGPVQASLVPPTFGVTGVCGSASWQQPQVGGVKRAFIASGVPNHLLPPSLRSMSSRGPALSNIQPPGQWSAPLQPASWAAGPQGPCYEGVSQLPYVPLGPEAATRATAPYTQVSEGRWFPEELDAGAAMHGLDALDMGVWHGQAATLHGNASAMQRPELTTVLRGGWHGGEEGVVLDDSTFDMHGVIGAAYPAVEDACSEAAAGTAH
ncbi:hypothetical protein V8C86DRAFT_2609964 [Haematococcus lacustris]